MTESVGAVHSKPPEAYPPLSLGYFIPRFRKLYDYGYYTDAAISILNHIRQRISILQIANPVPYYQNILFLDPSGYCPYLFSRIEMMVSGCNLSRVSLPLVPNEKSRCKCFCSEVLGR
ncbi:hypothetical protein PILCRDRAFT_592647 [Piloderma croceum F 1598]|uniref:Uncharacterized protein n=1 Tax=Piloderma croceum (strain F 1598) TaxID=765440 RepID=A0A0C3AX02_PILCF|nr:hypothetical protein PILCRDRAFT_592647 [Piloderma croceum F 1598]